MTKFNSCAILILDMKQYLIDLWKHPRYHSDQLKEQLRLYEEWDIKTTKKYKLTCWIYLFLGIIVAMYVSIGSDGYIHPKVFPITIVGFCTAVLLLCTVFLIDWFAEKKKPNTVVIKVFNDDLQLLADQLNMSPGELEQMDPQEIIDKYVAPRMKNLQNFIDEKMRKHETVPAESDRLEKLIARSERFQLLELAEKSKTIQT